MKGQVLSGFEPGFMDWNYLSFPEVMGKVSSSRRMFHIPFGNRGELIQTYLIGNPTGIVSCMSYENSDITKVFIHAVSEADVRGIGELVLMAAGRDKSGKVEIFA